MKNKNIKKLTLTALLMQTMCLSVLLSHTHVKDVVALANPQPVHPGVMVTNTLKSTDIHTKALGDLHHHIDKTSVKNMAAQIAARKRDLQPEAADMEAVSLGQKLYDFILRLRLVGSMILNHALVSENV